jgi:hypothetical protein
MTRTEIYAGADPPHCDTEIYETGVVLLDCRASLRSWQFEQIVVQVREELGVRIDWHMIAGHKILKGIGDPETLDQAAQRVDELAQAAVALGGKAEW